MAQGFALIMTWPIVSPPFLAGLLAARNTSSAIRVGFHFSRSLAKV
jgi:hypothetical protein